MSHRWICAVAFALALVGNTAAQQPAFIERDDKDDPCGRFKLRILEPAGNTDYKLRVQRPAEDIDPKMVRNPCPGNEPQLAFSPSVVRPNNGDGHFGPRPFGFGPAHDLGGRSDPSEPLRPRLPSAFEMMRGRQ